MGSFFSTSKETKSSGDPIKQQAFYTALPYWQQGLSGAQSFYNTVNANPAYTGDRTADLNQYQVDSANTLGQFASQYSPASSLAALGTGFSNAAASANYGNNAQSILDRASVDPMGYILGQANAYSNNPYVNGLIDAAGRDVTRNLFEQQLPGIDRAATGAGNLNSTRAGVQSAIAQRGAADRLADISSGIRSQFFGKGLDMAQNQWNQNLSNMMNANQGLYNAGNLGLNALINAGNMANQGFQQGQAAGSVFQNQQQSELNANKAVYDETLANKLAALNALLGSTSYGQNWGGGPQSGTQTSNPSQASQVGAGLQMIGSVASLFSDIRMKEKIVKTGKLESGIPVYRFEYKPEFKDIAGHGSFVGVMAQEIEHLIPEAVSVASNGYKMVDYSKVR